MCEAKLGKFPKLPARDVFVDFEQRYAGLDKMTQLPPLTQQAVDNIRDTVRYSLQSMLQLLHIPFKALAVVLAVWGECAKNVYRDDMAVVLKRQRLRLAGLQAQSRLPPQNIQAEQLQKLTDVAQGLAGNLP